MTNFLIACVDISFHLALAVLVGALLASLVFVVPKLLMRRIRHCPTHGTPS